MPSSIPLPKEKKALKTGEKEFSGQVEELLTRFGWQWMHIRPARVLRKGKEIYETPYTGHKGWLDYLALRPPRIVVFEIKSETAGMTSEQEEWFSLWEQCQKTLLLVPQELKRNKAIIDLKHKHPVLTIPEVYLWRPSQFDEIVKCLR